jgi:hypothetical protein
MNLEDAKRAYRLKQKRKRASKVYLHNKENGICAQTGCRCRKVAPPHVYCAKCLVKKNSRTCKRKAQVRQEARAC